MPYFLDGNNLIGLARRTARPQESDRTALVAEISQRLRQTRSSVRLFFDGPSRRQTSLGNLTVTDSGGSADEAIVREVQASPDPGQVTVVTADRDLSRRVREAGGKALDPDAFWSRFGADVRGAPQSAPQKPPNETRVDVDAWLAYFSDPKNRG